MVDDFQYWLPLYSLSVADLPGSGECPAVYALREAGLKQILKFGNTGQLRQRIFGNYLGGVGGDTTQWIHGMLFKDNKIGEVELAWLGTEDNAEPKRKEKEFRQAYKRVHGHRPPWDRQG